MRGTTKVAGGLVGCLALALAVISEACRAVLGSTGRLPLMEALSTELVNCDATVNFGELDSLLLLPLTTWMAFFKVLFTCAFNPQLISENLVVGRLKVACYPGFLGFAGRSAQRGSF